MSVEMGRGLHFTGGEPEGPSSIVPCRGLGLPQHLSGTCSLGPALCVQLSFSSLTRRRGSGLDLPDSEEACKVAQPVWLLAARAFSAPPPRSFSCLGPMGGSRRPVADHVWMSDWRFPCTLEATLSDCSCPPWPSLPLCLFVCPVLCLGFGQEVRSGDERQVCLFPGPVMCSL